MIPEISIVIIVFAFVIGMGIGVVLHKYFNDEILIPILSDKVRDCNKKLDELHLKQQNEIKE